MKQTKNNKLICGKDGLIYTAIGRHVYTTTSIYEYLGIDRSQEAYASRKW
jgi:hypothetical protein